jgi:hypothetical protein
MRPAAAANIMHTDNTSPIHTGKAFVSRASTRGRLRPRALSPLLVKLRKIAGTPILDPLIRRAIPNYLRSTHYNTNERNASPDPR